MALLFPLSISLERISHRETPTIKSDLIPWVHIAERQDLCAIFEKEAITTSLGYVEQQTVMKIKAGVKAVVGRNPLFLATLWLTYSRILWCSRTLFVRPRYRREGN